MINSSVKIAFYTKELSVYRQMYPCPATTCLGTGPPHRQGRKGPAQGCPMALVGKLLFGPLKNIKLGP